ncbi:MAG: hypothetical protein A3J24_05775 [Deltaproteobacteria bacterium RIFCSPLOWO2_02_FULL_53_8]|nr:MAG: hypothetical protein A3J24_05775 [Deltaproteobacteria bacterium RIFCSPLOWO2_02_FULL_53_8]
MSSLPSQTSIIQVSYLIPITEDRFLGTGKKHPDLRWQLHKEKLYSDFGGYTVSPGLYRGAYTDPDVKEEVTDDSFEFRVAVPINEIGNLRKFLKEFVGPLFRQKMIYTVVKGEVEFIESNRDMIKIMP